MTDGGEWLQDLGGREREMLEKEGAGEGGTLGKGDAGKGDWRARQVSVPEY